MASSPLVSRSLKSWRSRSVQEILRALRSLRLFTGVVTRQLLLQVAPQRFEQPTAATTAGSPPPTICVDELHERLS